MTEDKNIIHEDNAQKQIDLFYDYFDIDPSDYLDASPGQDNEAAQHAYNVITRKLRRSISKGWVEVSEVTDDEGRPTIHVVQTLRFSVKEVPGDKLTYHCERLAMAKSAIPDNKGDNSSMKNYRFLGVLTRLGPDVFQKLQGSDSGVVDILGALFLQA
jgi:hypothetical protein